MTSTQETIRKWWLSHLRPETHSRIRTDLAAARALRARLRRADRPADALSEAAVHDLAAALPFLRQRPLDLARLVQTLALVEAGAPASLPALLGRKEAGPGGSRALSELRFQRLLRTSGPEFGIALRRALPAAGMTCNVGKLGSDLLDWDQPVSGERVRNRWCFDYFGAPSPEPDLP